MSTASSTSRAPALPSRATLLHPAPVQLPSSPPPAAALQEVKPLAGARVPVVKFVMPDATTKVDVTINNHLPLLNTMLIKCYAAIDERVKQLIFIVKRWAKRRQINDAYRGTLSSYAYVMLCIFVAQKAGLVPVLQQEEPASVDETVTINEDRWSCRFNADVELHRRAAAQHVISIGGLLTMFFDFFAFRCERAHACAWPRRRPHARLNRRVGGPLLMLAHGWVTLAVHRLR